MIFVATLWPPANKFFNQITIDIRSYFNVTHKQEYDIRKKTLSKIVKSIYGMDKTPLSRIKRKLNVMFNYDPKICFVYFDIPNPTMLDHKKSRLKGKKFCSEAKFMKGKLREKYAPQVKDYIFDVIIHVCDNEEGTKHIQKIEKEYCN